MDEYNRLIQSYMAKGWRIESQSQFATTMVKGQPRVRQGWFGGLPGLVMGDGLKRVLIETDGWGRGRVAP